MDQWNELLRQFPEGFRELFSKVELDFQKIREIRIRAGREAVFRFGEKEYFLLPNGKLTCQIERGQKSRLKAQSLHLRSTAFVLCDTE